MWRNCRCLRELQALSCVFRKQTLYCYGELLWTTVNFSHEKNESFQLAKCRPTNREVTFPTKNMDKISNWTYFVTSYQKSSIILPLLRASQRCSWALPLLLWCGAVSLDNWCPRFRYDLEAKVFFLDTYVLEFENTRFPRNVEHQSQTLLRQFYFTQYKYQQDAAL